MSAVPPGTVSVPVIRQALRAIQTARPLGDSPLIWLGALTTDLRTAGLIDSPAARASFLPLWLEEVAWTQLVAIRGGGAKAAPRPTTPEQAVGATLADLEAADPDRDAWSLLYAYYFARAGRTLEHLATQLPLGHNTVRRRLDRGYRMLADVLLARENAARASTGQGRTVPRPPTRFIGRDAELGTIRRLMANHRLVVLTGPGGVGKSRLAIRLAQDLAADYPGDAWFVEAASLTEGRQVPQAVMNALGLGESTGRSPTESIVDHVADKRLLLVLDNCDHLAAACNRLIQHLLDHCPFLQVLATSRVELRVQDAAHWPVPPMALPRDLDAVAASQLMHFDAPRLFGARAAVASPEFHLGDLTAGPVTRICTRLDGLPLAIELAAARVREFSLEQIEARLADRFALLRDGRRATRRSHETLRAMMDWSYDLLSRPEQLLFQRLAVFRGGWTLESATAVCVGDGVAEEEVAGLLGHLKAKSLIQTRGEDGDDSSPRFGMLETVREYAEARLAEGAQRVLLQGRHADHFIQRVEGWLRLKMERQSDDWLGHVETDYDNLTEALRRAESWRDAERGLRLCAVLRAYWYDRGRYQEGRDAILRVLEFAGSSPTSNAHADTRRGLGMILMITGQYAEARQQLLAAKAMYAELGNDAGQAVATRFLGHVCEYSGELREARDHYVQALERFRQLGDKVGELLSMCSLASICLDLGDPPEARRQATVVLERAEQMGWQALVSNAANILGRVADIEGEFALAMDYFRRELAWKTASKNPSGMAVAQVSLGAVASSTGDYTGARNWIAPAVIALREFGFKDRLVDALLLLGNVSSFLGDHGAARELLAECVDVCRAMGATHHWAVALHWQAAADMRAGDLRDVGRRLRESLSLLVEAQMPMQTIQALETFSVLASRCDQPQRAARLAGATHALREGMYMPAPVGDRFDLDPALSRVRAQLGDATFDELMIGGSQLTLAEAVDYAMGEEQALVAD